MMARLLESGRNGLGPSPGAVIFVLDTGKL